MYGICRFPGCKHTHNGLLKAEKCDATEHKTGKKCIQTVVQTSSRKTLAPLDVCNVPKWDTKGPSPHFKDEETGLDKMFCPRLA